MTPVKTEDTPGMSIFTKKTPDESEDKDPRVFSFVAMFSHLARIDPWLH